LYTLSFSTHYVFYPPLGCSVCCAGDVLSGKFELLFKFEKKKIIVNVNISIKLFSGCGYRQYNYHLRTVYCLIK